MSVNNQSNTQFDALKDIRSISKTTKALEEKGIRVIIVDNGKDALSYIKKLIPKGVSVTNGSSKTLDQIGFVDYLKSGKHGWANLKEEIVNEKDPIKQAKLRKQAVLSDYYLGSVHALIENGEFIIASNTGSQLPHIVFTSPNLIFVVGTQKIVPTLSEAFRRLETYVMLLEDRNMKEKYGTGTSLNKIVIFKGENPMAGRKVTMLLVKEKLGF